jgi:hypothetical protein
MYCQSASKEILRSVSLPNTSCVGVALVVVCTTESTAERIAASTPSSLYGSLTSFLPEIACTRYHVVNDLLDAFNYGICLGVLRSNKLALDWVLFIKHFADFCRKFASPIHDDLRQPWISSEPIDLDQIGDVVRSLLWDLDYFEPTSGRIDHREAL